MFKDKGPQYSLGFGIPQSKTPITSHPQGGAKEGLTPNSGIVAKALYDHPVARFFAVSAATMVGTAVGSAMIRRGGVRLGERLTESNIPFLNRLQKSMRDTGKLLDSWEGVDSDLGGDPDRPTKLASFWQNYQHRKQLQDEGIEDDGERWLLRDELQQRLIRQARSLPYQLPAMYVANRASNSLVGNQNTPVNWKNPVDVIGDFAQSSVHQLASLLAPTELGQGTLKYGWQKMMTEGDFAASTHGLKDYGLGLRTVLDRLGQDTVDLLHQTTRRSAQTAGAFSTALSEAANNRQPWGVDLLNHTPEYTNKLRIKRLKLITDSFHTQGMLSKNGNKGAIEQAVPTLSGFVRGFGRSWQEHEDDYRNLEAARRGDSDYAWKSGRKAVDLKRIRTSSYITDLDKSIGVTKLDFDEKERNASYKKILEEELAHRIAGGDTLSDTITDDAVLKHIRTQADEVAAKVVKHIRVGLPYRIGEGDTSAVAQTRSRVTFGTSPMYHTSAKPWEDQFVGRLNAVVAPHHAEAVTVYLPEAMRTADKRFMESAHQQALNKHIGNTFEEIRQRVIIPQARRQLGETKLAYEDYGLGADKPHQEFLVRKTAEHLGIPLRTGGRPTSTADLRAEIRARGIDTTSHYQMQGILLDKGGMTAPWTKGGYNFFGMRPLTADVALKQKYFGSQQDSVRQMYSEMAGWDHSYTSHLIQRPVGKHVWESRSGKIVDLNPTIQGVAKAAQVLSRHIELPFLHFSPLDLTSFQKLMRFGTGTSVKIARSTNENFGPVNKQLPSSEFDYHVWLKGSSGFRGRGSIFGFRAAEDVGQATGSYYAPNTMGEDTWARNLRIAYGNTGVYNPPATGKGSKIRNWGRNFFNLSPEQSSSIPNLLKRGLNGEFGERYLGRTPDVENNAVLARLLLEGQTQGEDGFTGAWAKGTRNLYKEANKFQPAPAYINNLAEINPELAGRLRLRGAGDEDGQIISRIRDPQTLLNLTNEQFTEHLAEAERLKAEGKLGSEDIGALKQLQARIRQSFLKKETDQSLTTEASRAVATAGINTRMDELKGELYKYLVISSSTLAKEDTSVVIQDMIDAVEQQSRRGMISGGQRTETRAAILSMQMDIDALKHGGAINDLTRSQAQLEGLINSPARQLLHHFSNYDTSLLHHRRYFGMEEKASRFLLKRFGVHKEKLPGFRYNPYGGDQDSIFVPTFETSFMAHPFRAASSALGLTTWRDPDAFSAVGIRTSHLATRLNRYFAMAGLGVDEEAYSGPLGFVAGGLVGKRILPLAVGSALFFGIDAEVGGLVHGKDDQGNRRYTPLVSGTLATAVAHGIVVGAGITGGYSAYKEKRDQYFGDAEVPIRKGRYWPLGNQAWKGGRIQYYRPNWYKRFKSGYKYTDQTFGSPMERLAYDYDFSPLHMVAPYHFEKQHYADRPYPVTGDLFTGPWGPINTVLNATVGKVIKPHKLMHKEEFQAAMQNNYERIGQFGMQYRDNQNPYPKVLTRAPSGGTMLSVPTPTGYYLGERSGTEGTGAPGDYTRPYNQPYGFVGQGYGTSPEEALQTYREGKGQSTKLREHVPPTFGYGDADTLHTGSGPVQLKEAGGSATRDRVTMARGRNFDPRIIPAADPLNPGHLNVQAGQFGYDAQEMAGIYGFGLGTAREMAGLGSSSYTPDSPVLQQASRAYGSERSFWDLNLGGLGDFPTPLRGEYGNIEFSEIARRFIPHRRRDITELNPIPNQMASKYPWLPGSDYYINFQTGDPFITVPEGEMRLPGEGYERTHTLHPDETGEYGMLDKHRILGDVAPWSEEYRSVDKILRKSKLSAEEKAFVQTTRNQVAGVKKRHNFKPYKYAHADFQNENVQVTGFLPGEADKLITSGGIIQLAGVRARKGPNAMAIAESLIHVGDTVSIRYDANAPTKYRSPIDASVQAANGKDLGNALLDANQAYMSRKNSALDNRVREGPVSFYLHRMLERLSHGNNIINQKFFPNRSAVEEWERYHVYGSDFPQWTHPIEDFIEPLGQRARNRNPIYAGTVLSFVGRAFGRTPQGKAAGSIIGAGTGAYLSATSNAKTLETGARYIPPKRENELAIDEYCLPESTRALTNKGWKHWYELEGDEFLLAFDIDTNSITWEPLIATTTFDWDDELIEWSGRGMEIQMTSNHGWITSNTPTSKKYMKKAKDIKPTNLVHLAGGIPNAFNQEAILPDELVELIGWVITEGYLHANGIGVYIAQKNTSPHIFRLRELAEYASKFGHVKVHTNGEFSNFYFGKHIGPLLRSLVTDEKTITFDILTQLTLDQAIVLYNTCIDGDGWRSSDGGEYFGQNKGLRSEAFQALCALLGKRTTLTNVDDDFVQVNVSNKRKYLQLYRATKVSNIYYKGIVWCPTTPKGTWFAMTDKGETFWTGNTDILSYVKYAHLYNLERQEAIDEENSDPEKYAKIVEKGKYKQHQFTNLGPHTLAALQFRKEMKQTEYGADLFGDIMDESAAMPKRKRDYFMPFINSPKNEHARILSTSPRLERRMYEARWNMAIEDRPDLPQYFSEHELPGKDWEGWNPDVDMSQVELKMVQQQGIEASQMGYYPQQIQQSNLLNPSYPNYNNRQSHAEAVAKLNTLMRNAGITGDVTMRPTNQPGRSINLQMGVLNG